MLEDAQRRDGGGQERTREKERPQTRLVEELWNACGGPGRGMAGKEMLRIEICYPYRTSSRALNCFFACTLHAKSTKSTKLCAVAFG